MDSIFGILQPLVDVLFTVLSYIHEELSLSWGWSIVVLTVNGIRKIRTITVRTTIDHTQLRDSSSCMYESTVNRTSTRGCRMPKIESIRPFVLSHSSAAYSGRLFGVLRDHTLRGSTDCSAAHANPPGRIRESLPSPAQHPFRTASRWDDT